MAKSTPDLSQFKDKLSDVKFAQAEKEYYFKVIHGYGNQNTHYKAQIELMKKLVDLMIYVTDNAPRKTWVKPLKHYIEQQYEFWESLLGKDWLRDINLTQERLKKLLKLS